MGTLFIAHSLGLGWSWQLRPHPRGEHVEAVGQGACHGDSMEPPEREHVAKAVLRRDVAKSLGGSDRPSRVASARRESAARGAESCTKIEAAESRQNRGEVIWPNDPQII